MTQVRRSAGWMAALVVAAGLGAAPVRAERDPLEPPDLLRYLRWGPFRVRPALGIRNLGFDDNVFFARGNEPKIGDYRITLTPRLEGVVLFGDRAFMDFLARGDYTLYRKFHEQNFLDQETRARLTVPFERMGVFVEGARIVRHDRPNAELDTRSERREARALGGVIVKLGWRTHLEAGRRLSRFTNFDPDFRTSGGLTIGELLDRRVRANEVTLTYRLTDRTALFANLVLERQDFDSPQVPRDARSRKAFLGLRFGEGSRLAGTFQAGTAAITSRDPTQPDFRGVVGETELAYRPGARTTLRLEGRRRVDFAVFAANPYLLDENAEASVLRFVNRWLGFELAHARGRLSFPGQASATQRQDRVLRNTFGVRLRLFENALGRRMEYSLRVQRFRRDSNLDFLDQTQTSFGLGAIVGF